MICPHCQNQLPLNIIVVKCKQCGTWSEVHINKQGQIFEAVALALTVAGVVWYHARVEELQDHYLTLSLAILLFPTLVPALSRSLFPQLKPIKLSDSELEAYVKAYKRKQRMKIGVPILILIILLFYWLTRFAG